MLQSETIAIPVTKGVNINTEARLVQPGVLLEATNSRFPRQGGATKRRGHVQTAIRGTTPEPTTTLNLNTWAWGFGPFTSAISTSATNITPEFPDLVALAGIAQRDTETLLWDGWLMYSRSLAGEAQLASNDGQVKGNAVMPSLTTGVIAKRPSAQSYPDFADNGTIKVATWMEGSTPYYAVYDSSTGAVLVTPTSLASAGALIGGTVYQVKVIYLGSWVHIFYSDSTTLSLQLLTISPQSPTTFIQRSLGACNSHFDVYKVNETNPAVITDTLALIVKSNDPTIDLYWIDQFGNPSTVYQAASVLAFPGVWVAPGPVLTVVSGCLTSSQTVVLGYGSVYNAAASVPTSGTWAMAYNPVSLTPLTSATLLGTSGQATDAPVRVSVAPKYLAGSSLGGPYAVADVYWDTYISGVAKTSKRRFQADGTLLGVALSRFHQALASRAFSVGDRTFVWTGHNTTLQSTWFLLDEGLDPVGHMDFGIANAPIAAGTSFLATPNFTPYVTPFTTRLHMALGFKVRVTASSTLTGVFAEPSIKAVYLNFAPKLRSVQAGRCTYFAGAQVWSYDGAELTEAGFHIGPELATPVAGGVGSLTGTYSYRVDLCYRNAQNEEIRSLSILTPSVVAASQNITLLIPSCITRRTGSYLLIYRNAMAAGVPLTNWWLLNSRDPSSASFYLNNQAVAYTTVVDNGSVSDAAIQNFELHPATSGDTYLQPVAAPACEVIAAGHDRLWVSGGEVPIGAVAPSRLFGPGETPSFNPYLNIQVDRGFEAITAIGFVGNIKVFFRATNAYILDGDGPDNVSNGLWATPQLALADIGAVSQESLALITQGLLFQSYAGIRLMAASGNAVPIGVPVDAMAKTVTVTSSVVASHDQEVRWYCTDQVLVYSYLYDAWSTWDFGAVGATRLPSGFAAVARPDGNLWVETEGTYTDGPNIYTHRIRFPWLAAGSLGDFQRVRAIQGLGRYSTPHNVHVDIYYDERTFAEESFDWSMPDATSSNMDVWGGQPGSATPWGQGVWGDQLSVTGSNAISDQTWEWVRKPNRQKCSVFSVAIDDNNTAGAGFVLTALGLSLAKKPGLNRVPERGGTSNYRGGQ